MQLKVKSPPVLLTLDFSSKLLLLNTHREKIYFVDESQKLYATQLIYSIYSDINCSNKSVVYLASAPLLHGQCPEWGQISAECYKNQLNDIIAGVAQGKKQLSHKLFKADCAITY